MLIVLIRLGIISIGFSLYIYRPRKSYPFQIALHKDSKNKTKSTRITTGQIGLTGRPLTLPNLAVNRLQKVNSRMMSDCTCTIWAWSNSISLLNLCIFFKIRNLVQKKLSLLYTYTANRRSSTTYIR